jgi:hypothetical protein
MVPQLAAEALQHGDANGHGSILARHQPGIDVILF